MNKHEEEFRSSFEPLEEEQGNLVTEEFIEIDTPDFEKTYREIKHIIFDGFIPVKMNLCDSNLVLKSLYETEFKYIDLIAEKPEDKLPLYFLYSIVCYDSVDFLQDRKKYHHEIQEIFRSFPSKVINKLSNSINQVQNYHFKSYENLEGYLYENESRHVWDIYKKSAMNIMFPEINKLGFNNAQETWVLFNQREDNRIKDEAEYNIAKFVVSGYIGGKEIKKINNQEKMRWTEELRRRQEVKLKNKVDRIRLSKPINTAEDLVAELARQIRGEKDQHDKIIEMHENAIREQASLRRKELQILRLKANEENKEVPVGLSGSSKNMSKDDLDYLTKHPVNRKINPEILKYEELNKYATKLDQMSVSKPNLQKESKPATENKGSSIFDPEVQNELKKLKKLK